MKNEILEELWKVKDQVANEYSYNIEKLAKGLRTKEKEAEATKEAKFWMAPIALTKSRRFREHELREIERILVKHKDVFLEIWRKEQEKRGND